MLIIVEGADGSGKTTLVNRLRKDLKDYTLFLRSNGPPRTMKQLTQVIGLLNNLPSFLPVVTDRNPIISEYIYGPILRGKCMHGLNLDQMAKWFSNKLIIHCRPNYHALAAGVRREQQLEGVVDNHRVLVKSYDDFMSRMEQSGVQIKRYDYTGPPQMIMDTVQTFIREYNDA